MQHVCVHGYVHVHVHISCDTSRYVYSVHCMWFYTVIAHQNETCIEIIQGQNKATTLCSPKTEATFRGVST